MANPLFSALPLLRSSSSDRTPATAIRGDAPKRGLLQWWRPLALAAALVVPATGFAQPTMMTVTGPTAAAPALEGATAQFTVTLDRGTASEELTLFYDDDADSITCSSTPFPTTDTATKESDVERLHDQTDQLAGGATTVTVDIDITDDAETEGAETITFQFILEGVSELTTPLCANYTATIAENDQPVMVSVSDATVSSEGGNAEFTVSLASSPTEDITLTMSPTPDSATAGDYGTPTPATHTITRGSSGNDLSFTVTVPTVDDSQQESAEMFDLTVSATRAGMGPPIADAMGTATIPANDVPAGPRTDDPSRRADALEYVLAAFHRSTMDGLGAAIENATRQGMSSMGGNKQMKLAGQNLFPPAGNDAESARPIALEPPPMEAADVSLGAHAGLDNDALTISDLRRALPATDFRFALNHGDGAGVGAMTVWGGGNHSGFERRPEKQFYLEGGAHSGHLGADFRVREDVVVGLVLNHAFSDGDITFKDTAATNIGDGKVDTGLTSLHPFARWELGAMSFWGTLGIGSGHADLEDKDGPVDAISTTMRMATAGGRAHLWSMGSMGLAFKGDASVVRSEFNGKAGIDDGHANTSRIRMALEGNNQIELQSGAGLRSEAEIGLRVDGGAVGAGTGLDFGGNINYSRANFIVSVRGNVLATHSDDDDFNQWEFGLSLNHDATREGRGMKFSLEPTWGAPSGESAVWDLDTLGAAASEDGDDDGTDMGMDGKLSYGLGVLGSRGVLTPFSEMHWSEGEVETLRLGTSLDLEMSRALSFQFAAHQEYTHDTAEQASERDYYLGLKTRLRF